MSISQVSKPYNPNLTPTNEPPPLNPGDHLSRPEFERRYHAHPEIKKAELLEGIVYMPSPVRFEQHSQPHSQIITWLGVYSASTPNTSVGDNATVILDFENEPQPDALLRLDAKAGGQSYVTEEDYLEGPPELVVEIAASSAAYDMHTKRRVYARSGVLEYLVVQAYEQRVDWFILREGVYETLEADENHIIRSEIFPGLWLQTDALWSGELDKILSTLQTGLAAPEHAEFTAGMAAS